MKNPRVRIASTARWSPPRVVTNDDLAKVLDTSDEWIRTRTGIVERRRADPGVFAADMGAKAAQIALERAGIAATDLDFIILSSATPDRPLPSTACDVQAIIGATNAAAYDFASACSGFIYGLQIGEGHIAAGQAQNVLLICTELMSSIINPDDRTTAVLFGDGAAAVVLQPAKDDGRGLLASYTKSDGRMAEILHRPGGGARIPMTPESLAEGVHFVRMDGKAVFKNAVSGMAEASKICLERAGYTPTDLDLMIPHQANLRIVDAVAKQVGMPSEKVLTNMNRYGNMSSASVPTGLDEAIEEGRVGEGSLVLMAAAGAGLTWGGALVRL